MVIELEFLTIQVILTFFLSMTRIAGLMLTAPVISKRDIPLTIRVGLAAVIALSIYDTILNTSQNLIITDYAHVTIAIIHELLIGAAIGLLINLLFDGMVTLAQVVGIQMGQSSANVFNPASGGGSNPLASIVINIALLFFLFFNGLYHIFFIIRKSYEIIPIASFSINLGLLMSNFLVIFNAIFVIAIKIILPLVAIMFIVDVFVAIFAKIMPQANMYFLIMPNKLIIGMVLLSLILASFYLRLESFFNEEIYEFVDQLFT